MDYAIGVGVWVFFILLGVFATTLTRRMSTALAILLVVLLGPLGVLIVMWRCFGPLAGIAALVLAVGVALGAGYAMTTKTPDMAGIESELTVQLKKNGAPPKLSVDCPSSVAWDPGSTFRCDARAGKKSSRIIVTMAEDLQYDWKVRKSPHHAAG